MARHLGHDDIAQALLENGATEERFSVSDEGETAVVANYYWPDVAQKAASS